MKGQKLIPWLIVGAGILAYHNSFTVPFLFDDSDAIPSNRTIHHLWPISRVLSPPAETAVQNRPFVNLTLAINYALRGTNVLGYHALNLAIHVLAGLTLFGIVRRTLLLPLMKDRWTDAATGVALAVALIWTVHPLLTEAVTYVVQRAESLMGLLYLLTLYAAIRGATSAHARWWFAAAVVCCALGMGAKEVMATAPVIVLLYDRTFLAGSFREALRRRWSLYAGLAATWALLAVILCVTPGNRLAPEFTSDMAWWKYALSQFKFITHYLRMSFWPSPLVVDYGGSIVSDWWQIVPYAVLIGALVAGTIVALRKNSPLGFLGAWFFIILAPSSSVFPLVHQTAAEKRMYLPLAAVVTLVAAGGYRVLGQRRSVAIGLTSAIVLTFGILTVRRNADYRSEISIWSDTVAKRPENYRALNNLGNALWAAGRGPEAIEQYRQALRVKPDDAWAHYNLGCALEKMGRVAEAVEHYRQALQARPNFAEAHYNLATVFLAAGKWQEAIDHYEQTVRIKPDFAEAWNNLGNALTAAGRSQEAIPRYEQALRIRPDFAEAHNNLANVLSNIGRLPEAIGHYQQALRFKPDFAEARRNLEGTLRQAGE